MNSAFSCRRVFRCTHCSVDSWCPEARTGEGITCRWKTAKAVGNGGSTQFKGGGEEMQTQACGVPGDLSSRRLSSSTSSGLVQDSWGD